MADDDVTDDEFLAEMLQHLGHSTVKQVVEEALREYVGDGEGADRLVFETFAREVAEKAWDEGHAASERDWAFAFDLTTPDEERTPWANPYREGGAS